MVTWEINYFLSLIAPLVSYSSDSDSVKRQKIFLWIALLFGNVSSVALIPFAYFYSPKFPMCNGFSCLWLPWLCIMVVLQIALTAVLMTFKTIAWPRQGYLAVLTVTLVVVTLSHGGFERCVPVMALVGHHMYLCLVCYDHIGTSAKWLTMDFLELLGLGLYEIFWDPYTGYKYHRTVLVIEQWLICAGFCPFYFGCAWYLLHFLRQEVDQRRGAEALAKEESKAKAQFIARMSHEMRSPLNGVIGMLELLQGTKLTSAQQEYFRYIQTSASNLLNVLNDILTFSKLEAGKVTLERKWFNLRMCVEMAVDSIRALAHEKSTEIYIMVPHSCPSQVYGDEFRLNSVLVNLLNNACKFSEQGQITLSITAPSSLFNTSTSEKNSLEKNSLYNTGPGDSMLPRSPFSPSLPNTVLLEKTEEMADPYRVNPSSPYEGELFSFEFSIRDTGIGLTEDQQRKLFEPFVQADVSTTRKFGGIGLGLSICQQMVQLWKGKIWCASEGLGSGSTFSFTYPMRFQYASAASSLLQQQLAASLLEPSILATSSGLMEERNTISSRLITKSGSPMHFSQVVLIDSNSNRVESMRELLLCFSSEVSVLPSMVHFKTLLLVPRSLKWLLVLMLDEDVDLTATKASLLEIYDSVPGGQGNMVVVAFSPLSNVSEVEGELRVKCYPKPATYTQLQAYVASLPQGSHCDRSDPPGGTRTVHSPSSRLLTPYPQPTGALGGPSLRSDTSSMSSSNSSLSSHQIGLTNFHALVVDDISLNRVVLTNFLRRLKVKAIATAENGQQAIDLCAQKKFDVIFMDCHMPEVDGYEASARIRGLEGANECVINFRTPIVAVTAATSEDDRRRCQECGMTYFLAKPISLGVVEGVLEAINAESNENE